MFSIRSVFGLNLEVWWHICDQEYAIGTFVCINWPKHSADTGPAVGSYFLTCKMKILIIHNFKVLVGVNELLCMKYLKGSQGSRKVSCFHLCHPLLLLWCFTIIIFLESYSSKSVYSHTACLPSHKNCDMLIYLFYNKLSKFFFFTVNVVFI